MSRMRQRNQYELAFMAETGSEAPMTDRRVELPMAKREPESGGASERLMEEICKTMEDLQGPVQGAAEAGHCGG